jgi:hypothetical protein
MCVTVLMRLLQRTWLPSHCGMRSLSWALFGILCLAAVVRGTDYYDGSCEYAVHVRLRSAQHPNVPCRAYAGVCSARR